MLRDAQSYVVYRAFAISFDLGLLRAGSVRNRCCIYTS